MITVASEIARFAGRTSDRFKDIRDDLAVVLSETADKKKVDASRATVVIMLGRLKDDAISIKGSCRSLRIGLTEVCPPVSHNPCAPKLTSLIVPRNHYCG